jgi:hypothetical protein
MKNHTIRSLAIAAVVIVTSAAFGAEAIKLFDGKSLTGWKTKPHKDNQSHWTVGAATLDDADPRVFKVAAGSELINAKAHGVDLYSERKFGDAVITLDVMTAKGSNSGIYVMGEYEVQILDSFGNEKNPGQGDMGAIYGAKPPTNPVYRKPGEWSTFEIHFIAPRFDAGGAKTANARFEKVILNGATIHEGVEMAGPTPSGLTGKEQATGPLMFQGDHGPVALRNIVVKAK